jgi:protein-disulfide isomerase
VNRNRLLLLGAALGAAAVVVVVVILVAGTGKNSAAEQTTTTASTQTTPAAKNTLAGVPQAGDTLGKASAPVTLAVFEDPQCPFCRQWNVDTLPTVVDTYIKTGRVKLVYRGIDIIGPNSIPGLRAIYAAGEQNKLWSMVEELYRRQGEENSGWITPAVIRSSAVAIGADPDKLVAAAKSPAVTAKLLAAAKEANASAVQGTPTFLVSRPPGLPQQLSLTGLDPATFTAALDAALQ